MLSSLYTKQSVRKKTMMTKKRRGVEKQNPTILKVCNDDSGMCSSSSAYESDIYSYLRTMEVGDNRRPSPYYFDRIQLGRISPHSRAILVDWLAEVALYFDLVCDTLFLAVSFFDRFLSSIPVDPEKLQLLAFSSMFVASKYEHMSRTPRVEADFVYSLREVEKMEAEILKFLDFNLGKPTAVTFLSRFTRAAAAGDSTTNLKLEFLSHYIAELSLMDCGCIKFLPSMIAASAVFLANFTIRPKMHPWSFTLQQQSGYTPSALKKCVLALHDLQLNRSPSSLVAIRDKYKQLKFKSVATMRSLSQIPQSYFEDRYFQ